MTGKCDPIFRMNDISRHFASLAGIEFVSFAKY